MSFVSLAVHFRSASMRALAMQKMCYSTGSQLPAFGHGAGLGGGAGGSVREAGGAFGEREAANEEIYFRRLADDQLKALHEHHIDEIHFLEHEIEGHKAMIERHKKQLARLKALATK